jgi:Pyruvate/2-oxoacid:ferredoxin oxidoreductase delta subunit
MNQFKKIIIYYFSGTGNSKNVALWFANTAKEKGIDCQLFNIAQIDRLNIKKTDPEALIAFASPVHGFNYPPVMLHFIMRFPKGKNKVLLMNTRAGMLIGKFITPGLSGITFYLSSLILKIKGYSIRAMFPVDLPSNWISVHPGLNARTVKYLHQKNKERINAFADRVLQGKSDFRSLREIIQDILASPISLGYYFAGRFFISKTYYASKDCDNCDVCIKGCPVKAIKKVDGRPFWTFNCESCMKCMGNCPKKAIETAHGFIIGFMILMSGVVFALFYKYFEMFFFKFEKGIISNIVETLICLGLLGISYRIVHYLMRFRTFERLMVYTSLTKYKFWGRRYKALKDYDTEENTILSSSKNK